MLRGLTPLSWRAVVAALVAVPWVAWAVVRTVGFELGFPLVAVVAFTPYAALSSPLPVVVGLVLGRWVIAGVAGVAALALGLAIVPRAIAGPEGEARGPRLVVMTSNAYVGQADARAILRIAREHDVDVLSLQELRPELMRRLDRLGALKQFPGRSVDPRAGASGSGVLSRRPLEAVEAAPNAKGHAQPEVVLHVPGAPPVWVKAVHPSPPISATEASGWQEAMAALPGADARGDVEIMAGDFNATLDHRELRALLDRGWVDVADSVGAGLTWTWPAKRRRALPLTIDHVLVDRRVRVEDVTVVKVPGSDHRAVIAQLRLPSS
jgi:endonuclease/exonuclease/phosphatase (EEP) superfamily protein YafD